MTALFIILFKKKGLYLFKNLNNNNHFVIERILLFKRRFSFNKI